MLLDVLGQILSDLIGEMLPARAKAALLLILALVAIGGACVLVSVGVAADDTDTRAWDLVLGAGCLLLAAFCWWSARRIVLHSRA